MFFFKEILQRINQLHHCVFFSKCNVFYMVPEPCLVPPRAMLVLGCYLICQICVCHTQYRCIYSVYNHWWMLGHRAMSVNLSRGVGFGHNFPALSNRFISHHEFCNHSNTNPRLRMIQSWGFMSRSTARVILTQGPQHLSLVGS